MFILMVVKDARLLTYQELINGIILLSQEMEQSRLFVDGKYENGTSTASLGKNIIHNDIHIGGELVQLEMI